MTDKNPTPGEITIMAGGVVAFVFSFFHFYSADSVTVAGQTFGGGSLNVWSSGLFPVASLMVIFALASAVLIAIGRFGSVKLPDLPFGFTWEQFYLVLGLVATIYSLAYLLVDKGGLSFGIGFWLVLIGCIATLVGAVLLLRERATGSVPPTA